MDYVYIMSLRYLRMLTWKYLGYRRDQIMVNLICEVSGRGGGGGGSVP